MGERETPTPHESIFQRVKPWLLVPERCRFHQLRQLKSTASVWHGLSHMCHTRPATRLQRAADHARPPLHDRLPQTISGAHSLTHSLSHTHTHTLTHSHTHTLTLTHSFSLFLSLSLSHTHTHTHTHYLSHTHTLSLSLSLSLSHTHIMQVADARAEAGRSQQDNKQEIASLREMCRAFKVCASLENPVVFYKSRRPIGEKSKAF